MNKSLTKNSIFYFIYNILNMVFPFFTSMYVARVLSPTSIGEVAYAQNIVSYFSILAFLGLPTYGLREISKARNNYDELSKLFSELFLINLASTIVFSLAYYGMIFSSVVFKENLLLYSVVGVTVILNMLNISWLYEGLEEFRYVTIRNAMFKFLMFALLLLSVKEENDIIPYATITVVGVAGNNIVNIIHSRKFVKFEVKDLNLSRHMKSIFMLVVVNIAIEIYSLIGTSLLGVLSTKESVAYYSYAGRVNSILKQVTNTFTMVLVPRIALYYGEGKITEFNQLLTKVLKIIVLLAIPMIIGMQFTADFLFCQLFGDNYIRSAFVERILCFGLLISPIGYLLGSRVMLVSGHEDKMVVCVTAGAIVNTVCNYCLIQVYGEIGAAIAAIISEIVVAVLYVNFGRKVFHLFDLKSSFVNVGFSSAMMAAYLWVVTVILKPSWFLLLLQVVGAACIYAIVLTFMKDTIFCEYSKRLFSRFN